MPHESELEMTATDIQQKVQDVVASLIPGLKFLHHGQDEFVSRIYLLWFCSPDYLQGQDLKYNHSAFLAAINQFFFISASRIARHAPHKFKPLFPLPAIALGATLVSLSAVNCLPSLTTCIPQVELMFQELATGARLMIKLSALHHERYRWHYSELKRMWSHEYY